MSYFRFSPIITHRYCTILSKSQAFIHSYVYPRYAWVMYDWYQDGWWTLAISDDDDVIDCKDHELAGFLDKALTIQLPDVSNETTDIGTVR